MNIAVFEPAEAPAILGVVGITLTLHIVGAARRSSDLRIKHKRPAELVLRYVGLLGAGAFLRRDMGTYGIGIAYA